MKRTTWLTKGLLIVVAACLFVILSGKEATASSSVALSGSGALHYTHTATAANTASNSTYLDDENTKGNPNAYIQVTPLLNGSTVYNNHTIGVWYDTGRGQWAIFNQDGAAMSVNTAFMVRTLKTINSNYAALHQATAANISGSTTFLDVAALNNHPNMYVLVTPVWNPAGIGGTYNNHPYGVWYSTASGRWGVFNEDGASMPVNAAFYIEYGTLDAVTSPYASVQTANAANSHANYMVIDHPYTNGHPEIHLHIGAVWNPGGVGGTWNNHNLGIWYSTYYNKWTVFTQDYSAIPTNASFFVMAG
jgi:hypothetical protein